MKKLRELRKAKGLSQQQLSLEINISQAVISKYELDISQPSIETIIKIANYFNVTTDYLMENPYRPISLNDTDLLPEESELITDYRRLNPMKKQKAQAYIKGLAEN